VEIIELQIVKMEIGGFGEKLRSLEEMGNYKTEFMFLHKFRMHPQLTADGTSIS